MTKREEWIDVLKGFAIFCVTFGHLSCNCLLEKHIYSFHMFLFFFISGYLYNSGKGSIGQYISKKIKTILVPFICWNTISILVQLFISRDTTNVVNEFFLLKGEITWNAPIWFLWVLFLTQIVHGILERKTRFCNKICILGSLVCCLFSQYKTTFLLNLLPIALFSYTLGNIFKQAEDKTKLLLSRKSKKIIVLSVLFLINIIFGVFLNIRISYTYANFGNIIYFLIAAVSGTLFYILLFKNFACIKSARILSYVGKRTINIMAIQYVCFTLYDVVAKHFFNVSVWHYRNTLKAFVVAVFTMFVICVLTETLKKIGEKFSFVRYICNLFGLR